MQFIAAVLRVSDEGLVDRDVIFEVIEDNKFVVDTIEGVFVVLNIVVELSDCVLRLILSSSG